ncbi:MAG: tyrosine-type recombinase/integrase [Mailhella sp.]|nr:tyrosine-type recombinase/integrase [Mailhella sp.]
MMYIQRRSGGRYYFRMAIPSRLMGYYGRREICLSLGTADRKEAKVKSLPLIQKYLMEFEGKRMETADTSAVEHPVEKGFKFSSIYEEYLNERKLGAGSISDFNTVVNRFIKICGDKDIREYTKKDFVRFKNILLEYPSFIGEKDKGLSVDEILRKYKNEKKVSALTIQKKYLSVMKVIFNYAKVNEYISDNPVETVKVVVSEKKEPARIPYSLQQIETILSSSLFRGSVDEKLMEYRFIVLVAIFTGARLEEIARLRITDIGEEDGIPYIFIQPHDDDGHTVKTTSARRRTPLHPNLMGVWGFRSFVDCGRCERRKYLFPVMNRGKVGTKGAISHNFSRWYGMYLDEIGLKDKKLTFHSYRHSFKLFGRRAGVDKSILDVIQGHSVRSVSFDYGKDAYGSPYPLKVLFEAVTKIEELAKLKPSSN